MNPIYQQFLIQNSPINNVMQLFTQFRKSFTGNAQEQVQQMLRSGQITQQQYDRAVAQARQFQNLLK